MGSEEFKLFTSNIQRGSMRISGTFLKDQGEEIRKGGKRSPYALSEKRGG